MSVIVDGETLPSFGSSARCQKCGHKEADTEYVEQGEYEVIIVGLGGAKRIKRDVPIPEHLLRTCKNCGYEWKEACYDAD